MVYYLTAFQKDSSEVLNERFEAATDDEAIRTATLRLKAQAEKLTHRLTRSGKLLLFCR
ncbi:YhzD family protein [Shouchella clausii]|uniref:YhzD family protein n=1 Tax=Shouchella clausii TaxID=79880 RepID=UPI000BA78956|nr:YhzD family protein [Shouchella clausii]PAE94136.1 hypothetical protein CHH70_10160 [Shouchella clausii]